jgi:hypothetical protein
LEEGRLPSRAFESLSDLLVGIGPLVDRYLADAPIDEVTDFELDLFQLTRRPRPGRRDRCRPAARTSGSPKRPGATLPPLDWKLRNGEYAWY